MGPPEQSYKVVTISKKQHEWAIKVGKEKRWCDTLVIDRAIDYAMDNNLQNELGSSYCGSGQTSKI